MSKKSFKQLQEERDCKRWIGAMIRSIAHRHTPHTHVITLVRDAQEKFVVEETTVIKHINSYEQDETVKIEDGVIKSIR